MGVQSWELLSSSLSGIFHADKTQLIGPGLALPKFTLFNTLVSLHSIVSTSGNLVTEQPAISAE